jgi:endonuclease G
MTPRERIDRAARARAEETREARAKALQLAIEASIVRSEPDLASQVTWLRERLDVDTVTAAAIAAGDSSVPIDLAPQLECVARAFSRTRDFQHVRYVERARKAANAVGRLVNGTSDQGTFFMISSELLITNHHVLPNRKSARKFEAQFGFELDEDGSTRAVTRFKLDPDAFFLADRDTAMDYAVVALGKRVAGDATLEEIGSCPLPRNGTLHGVGTYLNIIQHPDDQHKQIVMRENRLVCIPGNLLVYTTDTDPGSSGSPVFNDAWQVVGLHHWGGTTGTITLPAGITLPDRVNEGIRASIIVQALDARRGELKTDDQRRMLDAAIGP